MVYKYGVKIIGLREASRNTQNVDPCSGHYQEIFYNMSTGRIRIYEHVDPLSHMENNDDDLVFVCDTKSHIKAEDLAEMIGEAVRKHRARAAKTSQKPRG